MNGVLHQLAGLNYVRQTGVGFWFFALIRLRSRVRWNVRLRRNVRWRDDTRRVRILVICMLWHRLLRVGIKVGMLHRVMLRHLLLRVWMWRVWIMTVGMLHHMMLCHLVSTHRLLTGPFRSWSRPAEHTIIISIMWERKDVLTDMAV